MKTIRINVTIVKWVALALGALGIIVTVVALVVNPEHRFEIVSYVALGVGVIALAGYIILDIEDIVAGLTGRRGQYALIAAGMSVLFVAILVVLYIVTTKLPVDPIDFTEEQRYALSPQTLDLLENLEEPVEVYAFFAEGYYYRDEAEIWLDLYQAHSGGMLTYEFIDPDSDPGRAAQLGMSRTNEILFRQADRVGTATIADEQDLTSALLQALQGEPRVVYVLTGHGERNTEGYNDADYQTIRTAMERENVTVQTLSLTGENPAVPEDADAVLILGPMAQLGQGEVAALQTYLTSGGGLMLLIDPTFSTYVLTSGVQGVAYSPDGERIVSAGADDTARVWDATSGRELLVLSGHTSDVMSAVFSPDGEQIATGGADGTVRLWDATTGEQVAVLTGHLTTVFEVQYSPAGGVLASVGGDQTLILWDLDTLEQIAAQTVQSPLFALDYSSDGAVIATGAADGSVALWDGATGEPLLERPIHTDTILGLSFSPDDTTVFSAAVDGTIGMLEVVGGGQSTLPVSPGAGITDLAAFPDGRIAIALTDNTVRVLATGEEGSEDLTFAGHTGTVWQIAIAPDGATFATASDDGTVRVWALDSEEPTMELTGHLAGDPLQNYLAQSWGIGLNDDLAIDMETAGLFDRAAPVVYGNGYSVLSDITSSLWERGMLTVFVYARSLSQTNLQPATVSVTELAKTSATASWGETNPFTEQEPTLDNADIPGPVALAMSAEDSVTGSRVVVIGDADMASNAALRYANYGNADFFLNAVNWLTQEETLIDVRTSETTRSFRPMDPMLLGLTLVSGACLMPMAVGVAGLVVWLVRRNK